MGDSVAFQIVLALAVLLLGYWITYMLKRPKLRVTGSGGGMAALSIRISNEPRVFRVIESVIFGQRIHPDFTIGPEIETMPVLGLFAALHEKNSNEPISHLFWQLTDGKISNEASLKCREHADLLVLHRGTDDHRYFVWQPNVDWTDTAAAPVAEAQYNTSREFEVRIGDRNGRRMMRFPVRMTLGADGRLTYRSPISGGTF